MSDTDDGFDEEAVREELREKYENEQEDRETTARMSELLLQGATMTNDHCDRCGSPIFRYDGQSFCPTCQHEAQQAQAEQEQRAQADEEQRARTEQSQTEQTQTERTGGQQSPSTDRQPTDQSATDARRPPADTRTGGQPAPSQTGEQPRDSNAARSASQSTSAGAPSSEATDALESSIAALARRAASADDPRTAREYLEAAREAAEALAALR